MKLSEVVNRVNGNVDRFTTELQYYIGGEHFESNELEVVNKGVLKENLGKLGFKFHFAFQPRDVIFMARNPHLRKAGMVMFSGLCSDASYILRSKDEAVLSQEYLAVELQSDRFWDYCENHKVGSVNFANNWSTIANYDIQLPSIDKQKEIASKVWAAYRLKESYKKLLKASREMVKSQFIEMFKDAPKEKLGKYINQIRGVSYTPQDLRDRLNEDSVILLRANNIVDNELNYEDIQFVSKEKVSASQLLREGDFIMCASSGSLEHVGKCALCGRSAVGKTFGAFCKAIRIESQIDKFYLSAYFHTDQYRKYIKEKARGSNINNLKNEHIDDMEIPLPSLELQKKFSGIYEQADKSGFELKKSIEAIDAVIKSLINNY